MKFNLKSIMHNAWRFFRKVKDLTFSDALRLAWQNAKTAAQAKEAAGVTEETHTWSGWKSAGYEVLHGAAALFKAVSVDPATKSGKRTIAYFGLSQVCKA